MQITIKDLEPTKIEMTVTLPSSQVEERMGRKLKELGSKAQIKGFRPGKVPAGLLKGMLGERALGETLNALLNETYPRALAQERLQPLDQGSIEKMDHEPGGDFTYVAVVEVAPRVQAVDYKGLQVKRPARAVTDEDVAQALEQLRKQYASWSPLEEGGAADGDQLVCDIQETDAQGVDLLNRLYRNIRVELGRGQYGPDFDVKMQGVTRGETRSFDIVNPEDDPDPVVAGKTEYYRVVVHELKRAQLAELDDEFAKEVPPGFDTLEDLKVRVRQDLGVQLERSLEQAVNNRLIAAVMEKNPVQVPDKMVQNQLDGIIEQARKGTDNPIDDDIVRRNYHAEVERNLGWSLVSQSIITAEDLAVTDADVEGEIARYAAQSGLEPKAARLQLKRAGQLERLAVDIQERKLLGFLREHADITDEEAAA